MSRGPCNENYEGCPYVDEGCYSDVHHLYWPSTDYTSKIDRKFRNLPANKERVCRFAHDLIHLTQDPPEKPYREDMSDAIIESGVSISRALRRAINEVGRATS